MIFDNHGRRRAMPLITIVFVVNASIRVPPLARRAEHGTSRRTCPRPRNTRIMSRVMCSGSPINFAMEANYVPFVFVLTLKNCFV